MGFVVTSNLLAKVTNSEHAKQNVLILTYLFFLCNCQLRTYLSLPQMIFVEFTEFSDKILLQFKELYELTISGVAD